MNEAQSAFIDEWLIANNEILVIEDFHSMKVGSLFLDSGYIATKLDMMKAYDSQMGLSMVDSGEDGIRGKLGTTNLVVPIDSLV